MFKSTTIPWRALTVLVIASILLAACSSAGQAPTTEFSELATPAGSSETGAAQAPTVDLSQAQTQPTESVAQAPLGEATTEAPTSTESTAAATPEAATEAPTTAAGAAQAPTIEPTVAPTTPEATPEATAASSTGVTSTTPGATPVGTPSTLPVTGGSDDAAAGLTLIMLALGVVFLLGALGFAFARRPR